MARDEGDKPSKRRWGRGRPEEGPSEEDLGWLADLRGGAPREDRTDEPTGGFGRGRRGAVPADPRPASPAGGRGPGGSAGRGRGRTDEPGTGDVRGRRGQDEPGTGDVRGRRGQDEPGAADVRGRRRRDEPGTGDARGRRGQDELGTGDVRGRRGQDEPGAGDVRGRRGRDATPPGPLLPPPTAAPPVASLGAPSAPTAPGRRTPPGSSADGEPGRGRGRGPVDPPSGSLSTGSLTTGSPPAPPGRIGRKEGPTGDLPLGGGPAAPISRPAPGPGGSGPNIPGPGPGPGGPGPGGPGPGGPGPGPGGPGPGGPGRPAGPAGGVRPPGGPGGADPLVTTGMIRRAEMRRHLRTAQQLKVATLVLVAILLLAAYPAYLFTRSLTQDPVFGELNGLDLPSWASVQHDDSFSGSRWCIQQCRYRERTWVSHKAPAETNTAYVDALNAAGWRVRTSGVCPTVDEGIATCWQRDAYVMDMWVRAPICNLQPTRPPTGATPATSPTPAAGSSSVPAEDNTCAAALVTVKVFNAIDYHPVD